MLNELSHLPIILDPSHATGTRSLVRALARAGVAIGTPEKAISDAQSLDLEKFDSMMRDLRPYRELWAASRRAKPSPPSAE